MGINERVKNLRNGVLHVSQDAFGKRLGVTGAAISRMEAGERAVTEQMILAICREFNVSEEWLRTGTGEMFKERTKNQELLAFTNNVMEDVDESFKKRFFLALSKLDESDWATLQKIAEELTKED